MHSGIIHSNEGLTLETSVFNYSSALTPLTLMSSFFTSACCCHPLKVGKKDIISTYRAMTSLKIGLLTKFMSWIQVQKLQGCLGNHEDM